MKAYYVVGWLRGREQLQGGQPYEPEKNTLFKPSRVFKESDIKELIFLLKKALSGHMVCRECEKCCDCAVCSAMRIINNWEDLDL